MSGDTAAAPRSVALASPAAATPVAPAPSASAAPSAAGHAAIDGAAPAEAGAVACPRFSYEHGMRAARAAVADHRYQDASRAFDEAVRARPYDPQARAERAYARMLGDGGTIEELELARALTREPALLAQILDNEGTYDEDAQQPEQARVAFVRAERYGLTAAKAKLKSASRCTVTARAGANPLSLFETWKDVYASLQGVLCAEKPDADGEDEARAYACGGCSGAGEAWRKGTCEDRAPTFVDTGHMDCSSFTTLIEPIGPKTIVAEGTGGSDRVGLEADGNRWRRRDPVRMWSWVEGFFTDTGQSRTGDPVYRQGEGWSDVYDFDGPIHPGDCLADERTSAPLEMSTGCQASMGATFDDGEVWSYYDAAGAPLAEVTLGDGDAKRVAITFTAAELRVDGGGAACASRSPASPTRGAPSPRRADRRPTLRSALHPRGRADGARQRSRRGSPVFDATARASASTPTYCVDKRRSPARVRTVNDATSTRTWTPQRAWRLRTSSTSDSGTVLDVVPR